MPAISEIFSSHELDLKKIVENIWRLRNYSSSKHCNQSYINEFRSVIFEKKPCFFCSLCRDHSMFMFSMFIFMLSSIGQFVTSSLQPSIIFCSSSGLKLPVHLTRVGVCCVFSFFGGFVLTSSHIESCRHILAFYFSLGTSFSTHR
jgi:hypothetical protein